MKRAALYIRVSTLDQHPETQLQEVRQFSRERGLQIIGERVDHGCKRNQSTPTCVGQDDGRRPPS
jgi:DNA invertase Pin-like site-specific DNA recombinase